MRILGTLAIVAQLFAGATAVAQDELQVERGRVVFSYGVAQPRSLLLKAEKKGPGIVAQEAVLETGSRFLRLHFAVVKGKDKSDWRIEVKPRRGANIAMEIPRGATGYWSPEIAGDSATLLLIAANSTTDAQILIDKVVVSTNEIRPESITTTRADIVPIRQQSNEIQAWGQAVARIRFVGGDGRAYVCTGFLVAERLMMTNQHCLDTQETATSALIDFKFDEPQATPEVSRVAKFHFADYSLDYALVDLDKQPTGIAPLRLSPRPFTVEPGKRWSVRAAIVIQHPAGEFKQISIFNCGVNEPEVAGRKAKSDFGHLCNTLGGSSGSPVMDPSSGMVIGLHHFGFRPGMVKPFNQGVLVEPILNDIDAHDPALRARINVERVASSRRQTEVQSLVAASITEVIAIKQDVIVSGTAFSVGDNLFLTASSLASDADDIHLRLRDGSTRPAKLVRFSQLRGYALVRAMDADVPPLRLAEHDAKEGTEVYVTGFIFGDPSPVVDAGFVTSTGGPFFTYGRTSGAAPGLAGAPVTTASGEVVGLYVGAAAVDPGNAARGVPLAALRSALPEFASSGPEESATLTKRRWQSYVDLGCSEVMKGDVIAEIPLRTGERVVSVNAALEEMENLSEVVAPEVVDVTKNSARVQFQVQAERGFLNFGCKGGARASVAVTFIVASDARPVFKK